MSEKELKELDKEVVGRLLNEVKDFLSLSFSEIETAELIESNQLFIALRFLKSTYLEIVKRTGCILKFLARQNALPAETIDLIWKCQQGKHEEMVRVVYNIIKDIVPSISLEYIDLFFTKI